MAEDERQRRRTKRGLAVCAVLAALALPSPASADDVLPQLPEPVATIAVPLPSEPEPAPPAAPAPVSVDDVAAAVQEAVDAALAAQDAVQPTAPEETVIQPSEPETGSDTAISTVVSPDAQAAEPTVAAGDTQNADTGSTAAPVEPVGAPASAPAPAPQPSSDTTAASASTDVAATPATPAETPVTTSPGGAGQYQTANQTDINTPQTGTTDAAPASGDISNNDSNNDTVTLPTTWIWNWSWNCADNPSDPGAPPAGATAWTWNWNWDCPTTSSTSCSACNTAISIRILSPGDDGDVTQSNAATSTSVAQTISTTVQQTVQQTVNQVLSAPLPPELPAPGGTAPGGITPGGPAPGGIAVVPWPTPALEIPFLVQPAPWPTVAAPIAAALAPIEDPVSLLSGIGVISLFAGDALEQAGSFDSPDSPGTRGDIAQAGKRPAPLPFRAAPFTPPAGVTGTWAAASAPTAATPAASHATGAGSAPRKTSKPGSPWHRPPAVPPGSEHGLSTGAAATGSSSSLGGFALLLAALLVIVPQALPTLVAVGTRRPRGTAGRPPERPG